MKKTLLILMLLPCAVMLYAPGLKTDPKEIIEKWLISSADLTPGNLALAMEINGIIASQIVKAQGRLETGNFRSELCLVYNNLFGMKLPHVRATTATGANERGYAIYQRWYDSVKDVKLFQDWYLARGRDLTDYFSFLASIGYAKDPRYLDKVRKLCTV